MNQSILFNDDHHWSDTHQAVCFTAQVNGAMVVCRVAKSIIERQTGPSDGEPETLLARALTISFDLEEYAQEQIEDDAIDDQGLLELD